MYTVNFLYFESTWGDDNSSNYGGSIQLYQPPRDME